VTNKTRGMENDKHNLLKLIEYISLNPELLELLKTVIDNQNRQDKMMKEILEYQRKEYLDEYLDVNEAAALLKMSKSQLEVLRRKKLISYYKPCRRVIYTRQQILDFLSNYLVEAKDLSINSKISSK